mgnify:CR=1 FL=1
MSKQPAINEIPGNQLTRDTFLDLVRLWTLGTATTLPPNAYSVMDGQPYIKRGGAYALAARIRELSDAMANEVERLADDMKETEGGDVGDLSARLAVKASEAVYSQG